MLVEPDFTGAVPLDSAGQAGQWGPETSVARCPEEAFAQ
jgi:hypothetical protein